MSRYGICSYYRLYGLGTLTEQTPATFPMNIDLFSIHGLIRGNRAELGRDADTGGQTRYVIELAKCLGRHPAVDHVRLFTRLIEDNSVSEDYAKTCESLSRKSHIIRIPCGPKKYLRKELLWRHLDEFSERTIDFIRQSGVTPEVSHGHYVDAAVVAKQVARSYGARFVFTGHSLGKPKLKMLLEQGVSRQKANQQYAIDHRIEQEQAVLDACDLVITSTQQEAEIQYGDYQLREALQIKLIPPGTDVARFFPYNTDGSSEEPLCVAANGSDASVSNPGPSKRGGRTTQFLQLLKQVRRQCTPETSNRITAELRRFLNLPERPMILSICRPDRRKNLTGLVEAYGKSATLQERANLVILAGNRDDLRTMPANERSVVTDLLMLMDRYDLYGKLAIPKHHRSEIDVPEYLRLAARSRGVFVNPAHFELFGLTSIESAAVGLPFIATNDGGPVDVAARTKAGVVVDVANLSQFTAAIELLLSDQVLWQRMSSAGIRNVRRHYNWQCHCERYLEVVSGRRSARRRRSHLGNRQNGNPQQPAELEAAARSLSSTPIPTRTFWLPEN